MQTIDNKNLALVSQLFIKNHITVAVAESCTSGMIQLTLSQAPDAMSFFQGGITVYNAGQKAMHLDVNPIMAEACDSVSKEIAEQMSLSAAGKFNAEAGIAITGYAQPVPEKGITNCYAYIAVSKKGKIIVSKRIKGEAEKTLSENQKLYTQKIIGELLKAF
ncbi:MAG: CinA family protein [Flavobacteriia bacterium]|nr:CinA family protein [Flavobacteriia bacterium]MBH2023396.1 CinA family protein [Flavobacteriales bacterium]